MRLGCFTSAGANPTGRESFLSGIQDYRDRTWARTRHRPVCLNLDFWRRGVKRIREFLARDRAVYRAQSVSSRAQAEELVRWDRHYRARRRDPLRLERSPMGNDARERTRRPARQSNRIRRALIAEPGADCLGPLRELRSRPFETMITVAHSPHRERWEQHVVFAIWSSDDHVSRPGKLEQYTFERNQSRTIQMFDHFHQGSGIEPAQPFVPIKQRPLNQFNSLTLALRHAIQAEPRRRYFERTMTHVHARDSLKCPVGQQAPEQFSFSAAKVQDCLRLKSLKFGRHQIQSLRVERHRSLQIF